MSWELSGKRETGWGGFTLELVNFPVSFAKFNGH